MPKINRNLSNEWMAKWRLMVLRNAMYRCELCHRRLASEAHHVVSRRIHSLRYDVKNGMALCRECHAAHHDRSPKAVNEAMQRQRPADWEFIQCQKRAIHKYNDVPAG